MCLIEPWYLSGRVKETTTTLLIGLEVFAYLIPDLWESVCMCCHISFSTLPTSMFFPEYDLRRSVVISYLPSPVVRPSVTKMAQTFSLLFWCLGHATIGIGIVLIFIIPTLRKHDHNIYSVKNEVCVVLKQNTAGIHKQSQRWTVKTQEYDALCIIIEVIYIITLYRPYSHNCPNIWISTMDFALCSHK